MSTRRFERLPSARAAGHVCATASHVQRDLHNRTIAYPELFPPTAFDAGVLASIALATAFASPWLGPGELRAASRAALWTFGLDRLMDARGVTEAQAAALAGRCATAMASGIGPDPLTAFLVELRDELAGRAPTLLDAWRIELDRLLASMVRERAWIGAGGPPGIADYLDNSDNLALGFVTATHAVAVAETADGVAELLAAVRQAQRGLRLVNDLATLERDRRTGDLNALLLGIDRVDARQRIAAAVAGARAALARVRHRQPELARHVERQLEYNLGFYAAADYWDG